MTLATQIEYAHQCLAERGFTRDGEVWSGTVEVDGRDVAITVRLPSGFPLCLPEVTLAEHERRERLWLHVAPGGKICVGPSTGFTIDDSRPADVLDYVLDRAKRALAETFSNRFEAGLHEEFGAYWNGLAGGRTAVVAIEGLARPRAVRIGWARRNLGVIGESPEQVQQWIAGLRPHVQVGCASATLVTACVPLDLRHLSQANQLEAYKYILSVVTPDSRTLLSAQSKARGWPWTILIASTASDARSVGLAALEFGGDVPSMRGARRADQLSRHAVTSPGLLSVQRANDEYLAARTGMRSVAKSSVAVVGCGAVGSHLAAKLTASGVSKIALVDNDTLSVDNLRRHLLDLSHVGRPKVDAMKEVLLRRSPHLKVESFHGSAETVVNSSMVAGYDVLVLATGDPNLERMLNDRIHDEIDRVHVWLEPLGIGGHALVVRGGHSGCFRCLFDSSGPISNRLSFVHPGKDFTRTIAGCGGEFVPFADLDANRAAIEGARVVLALLEGKHDVSTAISWREDDEQLRSAGYALSPLGESMAAGTRRSYVLTEACPRCR